MKLEDIIDMYGWNDCLDMNTGNIYKLSEARKVGEASRVPVISSGGLLIGHTTVNKVREETR